MTQLYAIRHSKPRPALDPRMDDSGTMQRRRVVIIGIQLAHLIYSLLLAFLLVRFDIEGGKQADEGDHVYLRKRCGRGLRCVGVAAL